MISASVLVASCTTSEVHREASDESFMNQISIAGFVRTNSYREQSSLVAIYAGPAETDLLTAITSPGLTLTPAQEKHHMDPAFELFAHGEARSAEGVKCSFYADRSVSAPDVQPRRQWKLDADQVDALKRGNLVLARLSLGCD